jgi:hypothetical protein
MPEEVLHIENLDELIDVLAKKAPKEFHHASVLGMRKSVIDVTRWAKQNAPVDLGRLKASIAYRVEPRFGNVKGAVGSNVTYAPFVEVRGQPRGVGRIPWLRPAVEEHIKEIMRNFEQAFKRAFRKLGF